MFLRRAFLTLFLSLVGGALLFLGAHKLTYDYRAACKVDDTYLIRSIVQTGLDQKALKTDYLAEVLDLSVDRPQNLYAFDIHEAEKRLKELPMVKDVHIKRKPPNTLYVDYTLRQPIAMVADLENTAMDDEGRLFPFAPFYSPKNLPEVRFGLKHFTTWEKPVSGHALALELITLLDYHKLKALLIDVSQVEAESLGKRQIVVRLGNHLLRLTPDAYLKQLGNYMEFLGELKMQEAQTGMSVKVIDLRLSNLAYVDDTHRLDL